MSPELDPPDLTSLRRLAVELINTSRRQAGLPDVTLDPLAEQVGQAHAREMAAHAYMSHWNLQGYGPDVRYSLASGQEWVQENVFSSWSHYSDGQPVIIDDWSAQVRAAHTALMNSPGHRANILEPGHTHVGVGIAYDPTTGELRLAQEFLNRYAALEAPPAQAASGQTFSLRGHLLPGSANPLLNLAYEPFPSPMTVDQLRDTSTYASPAQTGAIPALSPHPDGSFDAVITLDPTPGLYHLRLWVDTPIGQVQALDWIIWAR